MKDNDSRVFFARKYIRDDNPNNILVEMVDRETGEVYSECFLLDGRRHRLEKEGPAFRQHSNGELGDSLVEAYYLHGKLHRENGPAYAAIQGGQVVSQFYYKYGVLHRDPKEGPAQIFLYSGGNVVPYIAHHYYVNGVPYRDPREGPVSATIDPKSGGMRTTRFSRFDEVPPPELTVPKAFRSDAGLCRRLAVKAPKLGSAILVVLCTSAAVWT